MINSINSVCINAPLQTREPDSQVGGLLTEMGRGTPPTYADGVLGTISPSSVVRIFFPEKLKHLRVPKFPPRYFFGGSELSGYVVRLIFRGRIA